MIIYTWNTHLSREVDLNGLDTNVLGTSSHGGGMEGQLFFRGKHKVRVKGDNEDGGDEGEEGAEED